MDEYKRYFFGLIGYAEGAPAPNWKSVLESLPALGMGINPKPGEIQPLNAPHHGITVMIDAGNNARGRIWLPADDFVEHDGNKWHTREVQVIGDGPTPGSIVWAWIDKGGAAARPFNPQHQTSNPPASQPPATQPPATGGPDGAALVAEVLGYLQAQTEVVRELRRDIEALKARPWPSYEARIGSGWASTSVTLTPKP